MIEINLIPDVKQELLKAQRARAVVISISIVSGIVAVAAVAILAVYVFGVQTVRSALADDTITKGADKLGQVEDLSKILTIQNQLKLISELNDRKNMDSRVFDVLAAVIPPAPNDAQLSQVTINADTSTLTLEGQTRSYDTMEVFKKTIDSAIIVFTQDGTEQQVKLATDISTSDISFGEDATGTKVVRFTLSFTYAKELFSPNIPAIVIKLNVNGNVTDSYLGIPKSIFAERAKDGN